MGVSSTWSSILKSRVIDLFDAENHVSEIVNINFDIDTLIITVKIASDEFDLSFDSPAGFRALDEGDLLEFWPDCSTQNGWLFEIESGGWFSFESNRSGFLSATNSELKEFFVTGANYCVNVLSWEMPSLKHVAANKAFKRN